MTARVTATQHGGKADEAPRGMEERMTDNEVESRLDEEPGGSPETGGEADPEETLDDDGNPLPHNQHREHGNPFSGSHEELPGAVLGAHGL